MNNATLICEPIAGHKSAPLASADKKKMDAFYTRFGVLDASPTEKNKALQKVIQDREFFVVGGGETDEMELRANERIFLLNHAS